jgi:transposase
MSGKIRYTEDFKRNAVEQVEQSTDSVSFVAKQIGVSPKSLYEWVRQFGEPSESFEDHASEIKYLKAELKRVKEERDVLKKAAAYFAKGL